MKKIQYIHFVFIISIFFIQGCKTSDYMTPSEMAEQQSKEIIACVQERDREGLKEQFCPYMIDNRTTLNKELDNLIEFIDGEIISYDEPEGGRGGGYTTTKGIVRQDLHGEINHIKTDKGKEFRIAFSSFSINKDNPDLVGIISIKIFDLDTYDKENGYPEGGTYSIYYKDEAE